MAGEGGGLEGHLHRHREACEQDFAGYAAVAPVGKAVAVAAVVASQEHVCGHGDHGDHTRGKGAHAGAEQSQLGCAEIAEYKHVVANDVEHVGAKYYPCGGGGVAYGEAPLREHGEDAHRNHAGEDYKIVWAYERHQFRRQPHASKAEIYHKHHCGYHHSEYYVHPQGYTRVVAYVVVFSAGEQSSDERGEAIAEPDAAEHGHVEEVVHERGRSQCAGGVVSHHDIVGEAYGD